MKLHRARIDVVLEDGSTTTYYLLARDYSIGRGRKNDIVIGDDSVSKYHAKIDFIDEGFSISDNRSKNGSFLNEERVKHKRLSDLDYIRLGDVLIRFFEENRKLMDTEESNKTEKFVEKEFFKFAETRRSGIASSEALHTLLDLSLSLTQAKYGLVFQFDRANKLRLGMGKDARKGEIFKEELELSDWRLISSAIKTHSIKTEFERGRSEGGSFTYLQWRKMAIPLVASRTDSANGVVGSRGVLGVCFFEQDKKITITKKTKSLLSALIDEMTFAMESERLYEDAVEKQEIKNELSLAREIQQKLLPTSHPEIETLEIASFVKPCKEISGDYFDLIPIDSQYVVLAIGDVSGKGIPAALLSSTVQAAIRAQADYTTSPDRIVRNLNRLLITNTASSMFLTLFLGILNTKSGELKYINAGHPPPILISRDREIVELAGTAPALGIVEAEIEPERVTKMKSRELLIMYTDGIIESQNEQRKVYGRKRLLDLTREVVMSKKSKDLDLTSLVDRLRQDVLDFTNSAEQADDLTLLAVRRK
jgi:serine phosphatase RsbU (regulator of sigma subunit)/pSer/pThr/pTyr-binding forkhead associated (FHA) protein